MYVRISLSSHERTQHRTLTEVVSTFLLLLVEEEGDVQTAVTMCCVLGSRADADADTDADADWEPPTLARMWFYSYIGSLFVVCFVPFYSFDHTATGSAANNCFLFLLLLFFQNYFNGISSTVSQRK